MSKFTSSHNKGFRMTFGNGFSISVQWGVGNYCEKRDGGEWNEATKHDYWDSNSAEIAVFDNNGGFVAIGNDDVVIGWVQADNVAKCITIVQSATTKKEIQTKLKALNL